MKNKEIGLHTLCLLDIKKDKKPERLMNCVEAINLLEKIKGKRNYSQEFRYIALLGMSNDDQKIIVGKENIANSQEIKELYPQSLIVLGKTNEKEEEALQNLY